ncbi:MAG: F0F1 ATP synthase subunit B [Oscillospiraceae bacterium]|mgnify:CR=1 FL=1|jgi:F-type H+-transporting ATPase subunit b|nr:F0F1 ATP synthase subunit B [Oscillospiraceae bacterium]MBQ5356844.1 F0F1 ATP synthase subunit B [Oscillospiraceae bacterium]MBQ5896960.1 F0F1 ATP synthase subunit B [Oscillospiraceae bacterium]MBQ6580014.1 F0F1 ATP synthase subunit B [Oscillospiraceae bacterium]
MDGWLIKLDANLIRTIVIQGATFLAFFMIVKVFFADKIKAMLEERKEAIAKDLSAANEAKENAEKLENEYAEMIKGAHDEKAEILHNAAQDGEIMKEKIVAEAREQAETIITNARKEIDRERTQAEKELRDSIVDMTIDAAEKISGKSFTKEDHAQLISESISMIKEV